MVNILSLCTKWSLAEKKLLNIPQEATCTQYVVVPSIHFPTRIYDLHLSQYESTKVLPFY